MTAFVYFATLILKTFAGNFDLTGQYMVNKFGRLDVVFLGY